MKITKEKVIYFLSLNLVAMPFLFLINKFFYSYDCQVDKCFLNAYDIYLLEFLFFVLPASLVTFIYNNINKDKYNIFYNSFLIGLIPVILMFKLTLGFDTFSEFFYNIFYTLIIYLSTVIISLIILKITDPLRRKIK